MTNVLKLILHRASIEAIPPGTPDGLAAGVAWIMNANLRKRTLADAKVWVEGAFRVLRCEPGPYAKLSDEELAGLILARVELKRAKLGDNQRGPSSNKL
jgi:hypothetical protein